MRFIFLLFTLLGISGCSDIDMSFKQIYVGRDVEPQKQDGHTSYSYDFIFETTGQVQSSWLKTVLPPADLEKMLNEVDFSHQFLYVNTMDRIPRLTVSVAVESIRGYYSKNSPGRLDVSNSTIVTMAEGCKHYLGDVRPFIVSVVERPPRATSLFAGGYVNYNKMGKCDEFVESTT